MWRMMEEGGCGGLNSLGTVKQTVRQTDRQTDTEYLDIIHVIVIMDLFFTSV